ncbi:hypothetical protein SAMN05518847_106358 [Paenibacillus sp. OV219]|nr:hypothetical protein SAMN05518847_106358 [Paenibacillus sp. OV219]
MTAQGRGFGFEPRDGGSEARMQVEPWVGGSGARIRAGAVGWRLRGADSGWSRGVTAQGRGFGLEPRCDTSGAGCGLEPWVGGSGARIRVGAVG